ncbi:MAG: RNA 2',3'-cyclic phosphodiesterase [Alphaproteobacteria bacterium]|nr:RNA 2',3'-cyclic phosphodiesterase [Alphaproteobacteria bacterium]
MMRAPLADARWIEPEDYHITLRFFGVIENHLARSLDEQLDQLAFEPFTVRLQGLDQFGGDKPRSIFASVENAPQLIALQGLHERIAWQLGLPGEKRKFAPHVTLARLRKSSSAQIAEFLGVNGYFPPLQFEARSFCLFSSRGLEGGGPYRLESEYPAEGEEMDELE